MKRARPSVEVASRGSQPPPPSPRIRHTALFFSFCLHVFGSKPAVALAAAAAIIHVGGGGSARRGGGAGWGRRRRAAACMPHIGREKRAIYRLQTAPRHSKLSSLGLLISCIVPLICASTKDQSLEIQRLLDYQQGKKGFGAPAAAHTAPRWIHFRFRQKSVLGESRRHYSAHAHRSPPLAALVGQRQRQTRPCSALLRFG